MFELRLKFRPSARRISKLLSFLSFFTRLGRDKKNQSTVKNRGLPSKCDYREVLLLTVSRLTFSVSGSPRSHDQVLRIILAARITLLQSSENVRNRITIVYIIHSAIPDISEHLSEFRRSSAAGCGSFSFRFCKLFGTAKNNVHI